MPEQVEDTVYVSGLAEQVLDKQVNWLYPYKELIYVPEQQAAVSNGQ